MSRILRRPMFRGGPASSDGVGITSGLNDGYATGGRVGYKTAGSVGSSNDNLDNLSMEDYDKLISNPLYNFTPRTEKDIRSNITSDYEKKLYEAQNLNPQYDPLSVDFGGEQQRMIEKYSDPRRMNIAITEELKKEEEKVRKANINRAKLGQPLLGSVIQRKTNNNENIDDVDNSTGTQKSLPSLYDEYSEIIKKANLFDQEELTKQKYLELSKFGLNLLRQPGGPVGGKPNLMGAIAAAAEKPLEGYSNILTRESQAKQVPKQLALQATLNAMAPGTFEKNIQGLIRAGLAPKKALEFMTKEGTYQQRAQDRLEQDYYAPALGEKFKLKKPPVIQTAGKSFVDWLKIDSNLTPGQISELPVDKNLAIDKKYYIDPNTGVIVRFDKKIKDYREAGEI
jgi:hypothetical protein